MKMVPDGEARPAGVCSDLVQECERLRRLAAELEAMSPPSRMEARRVAEELREVAAVFQALYDPDWTRQIDDRHRFHGALAREWARSRRSGSSLALLMIGIDQAADPAAGEDAAADREALVVQVLRQCLCRPADRVARYGAGRFVALLPEVDRVGAVSVATRMQGALRDAQTAPDREQDGESGIVTVSIGVGTAPWPDDFGARSLLTATEEALGLAVELGGDQIVEGA
jgi:two-component system, sensor histidine kinase ChiS